MSIDFKEDHEESKQNQIDIQRIDKPRRFSIAAEMIISCIL